MSMNGKVGRVDVVNPVGGPGAYDAGVLEWVQGIHTVLDFTNVDGDLDLTQNGGPVGTTVLDPLTLGSILVDGTGDGVITLDAGVNGLAELTGNLTGNGGGLTLTDPDGDAVQLVSGGDPGVLLILADGGALRLTSPDGSVAKSLSVLNDGSHHIPGGILTEGTIVAGDPNGAASFIFPTELYQQTGLVTDPVFDAAIVGDNNSRLTIRGSGDIEWGPGGVTPPDTFLKRGPSGGLGLVLTPDLIVSRFPADPLDHPYSAVYGDATIYAEDDAAGSYAGLLPDGIVDIATSLVGGVHVINVKTLPDPTQGFAVTANYRVLFGDGTNPVDLALGRKAAKTLEIEGTSSGLCLHSPDGVAHTITVDNAGALVVS